MQTAEAIRSKPPGKIWCPSLLDAEKHKIPLVYDIDIHKIASCLRPELVGESQPLRPEEFSPTTDDDRRDV